MITQNTRTVAAVARQLSDHHSLATQKLNQDFLKRACPHKYSAKSFDAATARHAEIIGKEI